MLMKLVSLQVFLAGSFVEGVVCFPATSLTCGGRDDGTAKELLIRWDFLGFDGTWRLENLIDQDGSWEKPN